MKDFNYKYIVVILGFVFLGFCVFILSKAHNITDVKEVEYSYPDFKPKEEDKRIDVLLLGIRGASDPQGGLLTDTIILISFDEKTKKMAIVSIPRDIYVSLPDYGKAKINFAYSLGESRDPGGGGMSMSKEAVQYISGIFIDHVVVVNFEGFKDAIDVVGGIEVLLEKPFLESSQWQGEGKEGSRYWRLVQSEDEQSEYWEFYIPEGRQVLNGEEALYYIRSRRSTSDFDRSRRQHMVLDALREKALSLKILANPIKALEILDVLGDNARTTMNISDINKVLSLAGENQSVVPENNVLTPGRNSAIKEDNIDGKYVIVPKRGDWEDVRSYFGSILKDEQ